MLLEGLWYVQWKVWTAKYSISLFFFRRGQTSLWIRHFSDRNIIYMYIALRLESVV